MGRRAIGLTAIVRTSVKVTRRTSRIMRQGLEELHTQRDRKSKRTVSSDFEQQVRDSLNIDLDLPKKLGMRRGGESATL